MRERLFTEAFVLKKRERGEADQNITLYTKEFGKIDLLGKGIRKIDSKLKSGIDEYSKIYIEFIETSKRKTLVEAKNISKFLSFKKEGKIELIEKIKELVDNLIKEEEKDIKIWLLLKNVFFEKEKIKNYSIIYYYFFYNFISYLGYKPNINNCFVCQKKLKLEEIYFLEEKGFIDYNCSKSKDRVLPETIKLIKFFLENDLREVKKIKTDNINFFSLENISKKISWMLL